ncbi:protein FAM210A-like [Physella acuta]|uniref:protein FAM210A-like n=1 Tax=Physella acuta TaxID=109671 RepID=UPI0027DC9176|nr:protein FAM210A-like [Physella acuta]
MSRSSISRLFFSLQLHHNVLPCSGSWNNIYSYTSKYGLLNARCWKLLNFPAISMHFSCSSYNLNKYSQITLFNHGSSYSHPTFEKLNNVNMHSNLGLVFKQCRYMGIQNNKVNRRVTRTTNPNIRQLNEKKDIGNQDDEQKQNELKTSSESASSASSENVEQTEKLSLYQRFKKTYKEHGKVLVGVHLVTSAAWFGTFYLMASSGLDIVPYLEEWNFSEKIISPFRSGGLGHVAVAYLMYKLATPARYTVTIGGTNLVIRYLKKEGKMKAVPKEDTLTSLYKEGKEKLKKKSTVSMRKLRRRNRPK